MRNVKDQVVEEIRYLVDEGEHQFEFEAPEKEFVAEYVVTLDGTLLKHFKFADEALEFLDNFKGFVDVEVWSGKGFLKERYPEDEYPDMHGLEIEFPVCIVNLDSSALEARDKSLLDELLTDEQLSDMLGYTVERFTDEQILSLCQNGKTVLNAVGDRFECYVIKEVVFNLEGDINKLRISSVSDVAVVSTSEEASRLAAKQTGGFCRVHVYARRTLKKGTSFCRDCGYFWSAKNTTEPCWCELDEAVALRMGFYEEIAESYAERKPTDTCPRFKRASE